MLTTIPDPQIPGTLARPIPLAVKDVTTGWLSDALSSTGAAARVADTEVERIIWGSATKILIRAACETANGQRMDMRLCVKGAFDEKLRAYSADAAAFFTVEAAFYRDVAAKLPMRLPKCLFAEEDGAFGVVILEDLVARGCTFGDPLQPLRADQAASLLDGLAGLHAGTFGWRAGAPPWLHLGSKPMQNGIRALAAGGRYATLAARPEVAPHMGARYGDGPLVLAALSTLWARDDHNPHLALCHGDAHLGNLYLEPDGHVCLLDWQALGLMPCVKDVAYFLGGALSVDDRRRHERALLQAYLEALVRRNGPRIAFEDAWADYRAQMLQGIVWVVVPEAMQPLPIVEAMNARYLAAMNDLDTLGALGL